MKQLADGRLAFSIQGGDPAFGSLCFESIDNSISIRRLTATDLRAISDECAAIAITLEARVEAGAAA